MHGPFVALISKQACMHLLFSLLASILLFFCTSEKEKNYTGSTPAAPEIRTFLGISLTDSIDFIRWKVSLQNDHYSLHCHYGIGKPNTNGFINGGKQVRLQGRLNKKENIYLLQQDDKILYLLELNNNLVHLLDAQQKLLTGNGGWSYTLNNEIPLPDGGLNLFPGEESLPDSAIFQGRTPCLPFAYAKQGPHCYKLKWWLVLYAHPQTGKPATYYLKGTVVDHERKSGTWSIHRGQNGRIIYHLRSAENEVLELVKLDENILAFADREGMLLTGNEDFSYTLNRKQ
jgi:hypothetical protein